MTNGDAVRAMTDEELALLIPTGDCYSCLFVSGNATMAKDCYGCAIHWLKEERKNESQKM